MEIKTIRINRESDIEIGAFNALMGCSLKCSEIILDMHNQAIHYNPDTKIGLFVGSLFKVLQNNK